jgi:hypothetical protein
MDYVKVELSELIQRDWSVDGPIMAMPFTDAISASRASELAAARSGAKGLLLAIHDDQRQGFVPVVNLAFAATKSPWFGFMAQDAFAGREWMALALQALHKNRGVLLGFNDGKWQGALASFGLASRAWASTNYPNGAFFHDGYQRHYADAELTVLALQAQGYVYDPNSVLVEVDWAKDGAGVHAPDRALYRQRAALGFDSRVKDTTLANMFA